MYFCVKYIDLNTFLKTKDVDIKGELDDNERAALSVKNKELLVNPDCYIGIIMNYIFDEVGIKESMRAQFDMMSDRGKLLNVNAYPLDYCAVNIFNDRAMYFVAHCEFGEAKPLIGRKSKEYLNLIENRKKGMLKKTRSKSSRGSTGNEFPTLSMSSVRSLKSNNSK